jgi:hypothetical protein
MRIHYLACIGFFLLQIVAHAQIQDDFSDGNFTSNPAWIGDDSLFVVQNQQLRSRGTIGKDINLATQNSFTNNCEWRFWIRNAFSPSAQNFCRYYLLSDQPNLKDSLNGYYVQLGGITGNNDSLMLFKQTGMNRTLIIGGRKGTVAKNNNLVRIRVIRDAIGNWQLFSDTTGGFDFIAEGTGFDNEYSAAGYMGCYFRFTSGNAQNLYLDDVYAGPEIIDLDPPSVLDVTVSSPTEILIRFNERVDQASATEVNNYSLNSGMGNPIAARMIDASTVSLTFFSALQSPNNYVLSVSNVEDMNGNEMQTEFFPFTYVMPKRGDILISEFFPDPTPVVALPEQEFVELYNNSPFAITLNGWTISDDTRTANIPTVTIQPDSFIILCATTHVSLFSTFGRTVGVTSFPSLNNGGDDIIIRDAAGNIIDALTYDMTWYDDPSKNQGGWTIELVNPLNTCLGQENYRVAIDARGGTPGRLNSQWNKLPDTIPPQLINVFVQDAQSVLLQFDKRLDESTIMDVSMMFSPQLIISRSVLLPNLESILVTVAPSLVANQNYTITVSNLRDCNGNIMTQALSQLMWVVPDTAQTFDILITEFMADPTPEVQLPNAEYIELYNRSNRIISLQGWTLTDNAGRATLPAINLLPDSFVVFTSTSSASRFSAFRNVYGISGFPSLGNSEDEIVLRDHLGRIIHALTYTDSWYQDNVKRNGGWSLEIMDINNPCAGNENWRASLHPSGGTPGKPNSVKRKNIDTRKPDLIQSHLLAPNQLRLRFSEPMDTITLLNTTYYAVNGMPPPISVQPMSPFYRGVVLTYSDSFADKQLYRIVVDGVKDCVGNGISTIDYSDFSLPHKPSPGDVVINEILFDPRGSGADYVELYNPTDKAIDLSYLYLANANSNNQINSFFQIEPEGYTLLSDDYAVLTDDPQNIKQEYTVRFPLKLINIRMPSFPNASGSCIIMDQAGLRYEQLDYTSRMHFRLLDDPDGVALERIKPTLPVDESTNWTSAATSAGYGTPTYRNSQFMDQAKADGSLTVFPESFSPDNDGYNDVVTFTYDVGMPGFSGNMRIFDSNGRLIFEPMRGQILGSTGTVIWDGIDAQNKKAPIGIYMVWFEYFNLKGEVFRAKKAFVLAGRL